MNTPQTPEQFEEFLNSLPTVRPSVLFRAKLSTRLFFRALFIDLPGHLLVKTLSLATVSTSFVIAVVAITFIYSDSTVYAGSPFYGLKQTIENIEFSLTAHSPEQQSAAYLKLADRRRDELMELRSKVGENSPAFKRTIYELVKDTNKALHAAKESTNPSLKTTVSLTASQHAVALKSLTSSDTDNNTSGSGSQIGAPANEAEDKTQGELVEQAARALDNIANVQTTNSDDRTVVTSGAVPTVSFD